MSGVSFDSTSNSGTASLSLPPEVFSSTESTGSLGIAFAAYSTPALFPITELDPRIGIASSILGTLVPEIDTSTLSENVTITLPIMQVSLMECFYPLLVLQYELSICVPHTRVQRSHAVHFGIVA